MSEGKPPASVLWAIRTGVSLLLAVVLNGSAPTLAGAAPSDEDQPQDGGGVRNIVHVINREDHRLRATGNIQVNRILGPTADPVNEALAYASCTDCQTFAVALQIDLVSRRASTIAPQNAAIAVNERCTRCHTVARAIQYVFRVDDSARVPHDVKDLIEDLNETLNAIQSDEDRTVDKAEARIDAVIARFQQLAGSLRSQRYETREPTHHGEASDR